MIVTTVDIERDIEVINKEIQGMSDGACGSIYRCTTCYKLSTDHWNGTVKLCKGRKSGIEEFANSLVNQQRALRSHLDLMHSALLNNDAIKLANKKIVLQKGILAIGQKKLEKYAESSRLLAVARSQDALAFENFTKVENIWMGSLLRIRWSESIGG